MRRVMMAPQEAEKWGQKNNAFGLIFLPRIFLQLWGILSRRRSLSIKHYPLGRNQPCCEPLFLLWPFLPPPCGATVRQSQTRCQRRKSPTAGFCCSTAKRRLDGRVSLC